MRLVFRISAIVAGTASLAAGNEGLRRLAMGRGVAIGMAVEAIETIVHGMRDELSIVSYSSSWAAAIPVPIQTLRVMTTIGMRGIVWRSTIFGNFSLDIARPSISIVGRLIGLSRFEIFYLLKLALLSICAIG